MQQRNLFLPLLLAAALVLTACQGKPAAQSASPEPEPTPAATAVPSETPAASDASAFSVAPDTSVAFITGGGDALFDSQVWAGIQTYCLANGKECFSYAGAFQLTSGSPANAGAEEAIAAGHKLLVASGAEFQSTVYALQDKYPQVAFLLLNGSPRDGGVARTGPNTVSLTFDETQLGYLAGSAAVGNGDTRLGFLGDAGNPAQIRYGYGFIQGASDAAQAAGITVDLLYYYVDPMVYLSSSYETAQTPKAIADLWYRSGTQLIFSASALGDSLVIAAAEENGGKVITTHGLLAQQSAAVVAVAEPSPAQAVSRILAAAYGGRFPGGQNQILGCAEQAIDLDFSRMAKFGQYDYEHAYGKLAAGTVTLLRDDAAPSPDQLPVKNVNVSFIEG